jgi:hypothetical protein
MSQRNRLLLLLIALFISCLPLAVAQPAIPTNVTAAAGDGSVAVSYGTVIGAVHDNVYYSKTSPLTKANALGTFKSMVSGAPVAPLDNGSQYFFAVTAVDASGQESALSAEATATPAAAAVAGAGGVGGAAKPNTAAPVQPTTNVGQTADTNVQNPDLKFISFDPTQFPALGVQQGAPNGTLIYDPSAPAPLDAILKKACGGSVSALDSGSTYAIINIIRLDGGNGAQNVASNNWYVYSKQKSFWKGFAGGWKLTDFDGATRLYGASKILLVSIMENDLSKTDETPGPTVQYKLTITKQQPSNIADAIQLIGLVFPQSTIPAPDKAPQPNYLACSAVPVAYKTSSVKIDFSFTAAGNAPFTASQSFVNEAKEHWDVSFALPIKKASALQYSSTSGTVTASQINKSDLYAVFDWYPYPLDLKNSKFNYIPGVFAGVAMNSQPLHSLIFGTSIGTKFAQFYAGALLLKQQDLSGLSTGSSASSAQVSNATSYVFKPQFSVGIKISISAAAAALTSAK